jgi:Raf kinase inhibitor-like YbhB/YbcL family protein
MDKLTVTSPVFKNGELMPKKYSQYGENVNPPLDITGIPAQTKTLSVIVTDIDIPFGITITHWIIWNIPPANQIEENSAPGIQGRNSRRRNAYMGPRPPLGTHRYLFEVYALDTELKLDSDASRKEVEKAMQNHVLAKGELLGTYHK